LFLHKLFIFFVFRLLWNFSSEQEVDEEIRRKLTPATSATGKLSARGTVVRQASAGVAAAVLAHESEPDSNFEREFNREAEARANEKDKERVDRK
jgi:hypothetical protein